MQILFQFDVRAVALFVGMTFFVQATAIGAQALLIRELKQYRGVEAALLANLFVAVGLLLRLFADPLPEFLSIILSNLLLLTGPGLFYIALSQFTGFPDSKVLVIGIIAVALVLLANFTYWDVDLVKRILTFSLGSLAMTCLLISQLWRIQKTALRFSANLMLISFLVHAAFLVFRAISVVRNPPQDSFSLTPAQSATYLFSFAISFFWTTGFVLMVSHRLRNDLLEIATMDVLTHVSNRRATQVFLEKEISRAQRQNGEFSVLLIDIDDFKQVNDRWGHAVGDEVLAKTASLFQSMIRKQDLVGRWGGEEFLVIVPGPCDVEALAERIRSEIAAAEYSHGKGSFHITVSIGIACANQTSIGDEILKQADDALYTAKATKNAIRIANEE
ncbi:MAG TPA: GGDEF domain-containing protein [Anaerolineales bacterium]|jgi:diguanylate cyclase (GGDEF)-like protein|nr:GGDEF domain-containing protein [Anaerolineales bacterium]